MLTVADGETRRVDKRDDAIDVYLVKALRLVASEDAVNGVVLNGAHFRKRVESLSILNWFRELSKAKDEKSSISIVEFQRLPISK